MSTEETNIRISKNDSLKDHEGHKCRSIHIDEEKGIKAVYCIDCKNILEYLFKKDKSWTEENAITYAQDHIEKYRNYNHITVDQSSEFLKVIAELPNGASVSYVPSSKSFTLDKDVLDSLQDKAVGDGVSGDKDKENKVNEKSIQVDMSEGLEIVKLDNEKHLMYGVFLWPEKADHHGDIISAADIEKVAHAFMADFRDIDEMHKQVIEADIVESAIAWEEGITFHGKALKKGAWFGAVHVQDPEVWEKVKDGTYKGFSVRISGVREEINS